MEDEVHRAELVKCEGGLDWIQQAEAFNIRCFNFVSILLRASGQTPCRTLHLRNKYNYFRKNV